MSGERARDAPFAAQMLLARMLLLTGHEQFYSKGESKDIDTANYWLEQAKKRGFDESCFDGAKGA